MFTGYGPPHVFLVVIINNGMHSFTICHQCGLIFCFLKLHISYDFQYFGMVLVLIGARVAIAIAVIRYYTSQHMTVFLIGPMIIAGLATIFDIVR